MIKLLRRRPRAEGDEEPAPRGAQGISAASDGLRRALLQGLAVVLLPLLILGGWQLLVDEPAQRRALLQEVAEDRARQLAGQLGRTLATLRRALRSAAAAELAQLSPLAAPELLAAREKELLRHLPGALSLRLLPLGELGISSPASELAPLRNHIEIDLAQRAADDGSAGPEAYRLDGQWLVSLAERRDGAGSGARGVILLLTLDGAGMRQLLPALGDDGGRVTLRQRFANRATDLVSVGSASGDAPQALAAVPGSQWQLLYQPAPALLQTIRAATRPHYALLLGLLLLGALGFGIAGWRADRLLRREAQRMLAAADTRAPLALQLPQLLPLAREIRKLALRRARPAPAAAARPATAAAGTVSVSVTNGSIEGPAARELPAAIFRAYDIRGIAEEQLDDETVYRIGSAVATLAAELDEQTLVIGCDGRLSSARIKAVLEKALLRAGRDVVDIGLVPTPLLYFATQRADCSSGIMITGSHNPPQYNGMKIVLQRRTVAAGTIARLREIAHRGDFTRGSGRRLQRDVTGDYLDEVSADIAIAVPLKIVVDAGNGATSQLAPTLLEELGCEVVPLFCEIDGGFPNRSPDTGNEANLEALVEHVRSSGADLGVAFDGDGDRIAVVTGSGHIVRTDMLMMLLARDVVSRNPGADVVYDVKCSRNLAQLISTLGGRPILSRTGHAPMKEKMLETGALLGGEFSGHIFFGERWYGFDDAMYACARLTEILAAQNATLDDLLADLPVAVSTPEIIIPVAEEEKFALIERFVEQATFADGKRLTLDGLRVDFSDGWGLLRASNTSPALTARFEASNQVALASIMSRFREQLAAVAPGLDISF